jgi:Tfp pilus assembly protein PilZ
MAQSGRFVQRHKRLSLRVNVRISTLDPVRDTFTGDRYFRVSEETCADLSEGGAFVATHQPLEKDCRVMLELELPDGDSVQTIGRVVWTRSELATPGVAKKSGQVSGIGIAFTSAPPLHAERLGGYLAKQLPRARAAKPIAQPTLPGGGA